jgi:GntR family transcriptional regulator, transcriptional repressor for pyruvate dehydrogenase complex
MEMLNLIEVRPGDGTYVKNSGPAVIPQLFRWALAVRQPDLVELLETRLEVEMTMARRAASGHSDAQLAELTDAMARMRAARELSDIDAFVEADIGFHMIISQMAHIPVLADFLTGIRALLGVWMRRTLEADRARPAFACQEHEDILRAIRDGDDDGAAAAMKLHVTNARNRLLSIETGISATG